MKQSKKVVTSFDCNRDLKKKFTAICLTHGIKIGWQIEQLMTQWVTSYEEEASKNKSK